MNTLIIGIVCLVLLAALVYELYKDNKHHTEGFENGQGYFDSYYPKRTDVIPGQTIEAGGWIRDLRYKEQYVDVQKIGIKADLCRVVMRRGDPGTMIMACALAGTDGTPSTNYRTRSKQEGFIFSRDDYFRDINSDLHDDYCRIVKTAPAPADAWDVRCVTADIDKFKIQEVRDGSPPQDIIDLLWFFDGIMLWYRFRDDMVDYAQNTQLGLAGGLEIDEDPTKTYTEGLKMNYVPPSLVDSPPVAEQFIRIGENKELEFDTEVELRQLRSFSMWVNFSMFTTNARIFDFGNGAGHDNVYMGIEGRGTEAGPKKPAGSAQPKADDIVCSRTAPREIAPARFMAESEANVELYDCPGPQPIDPMVEEKEPVLEEAKVKRANLIFEIWDKEQRKMRIRVVDAIQERKWHHIAFTTMDLAFRPTWKVYIDGIAVFSKEEGHLPQTNITSKNYIGKSNWEDAKGQGEYKDEKFRGSMFDFRMYRTPMSEAKILRTVEWGRKLLNISR